jgi:hypothetical protein
LVSWNCKFNLKVLPSYYYLLFYQHWQLLLKWTDSLLYNSKPNLAEMFSMRSYTRVVTFTKNMATMWLWKFWLVDFQETSSQEPLKGLNWNLVYMFLWMSLTCVVTVCPIWKFQMATRGGQSLHWNPMGNNIFTFFLRTAEHNWTKLGRDFSCEVLESCPGLY